MTKDDPYQLQQLSPGQRMHLLMINAGSLSLRYQLIDTAQNQAWLSGIVEGVGTQQAKHHVLCNGQSTEEKVSAADHARAMEQALDRLEELAPDASAQLSAVGHRVLYAAGHQVSAQVVDDDLLQSLQQAGYKPFDQTERLDALVMCKNRYPQIPHVAVFDSAFFKTLPEVAKVIGLPYRYYETEGLGRQGYQGLSHKYASMRAAQSLAKPFDGIKMISAHLGAGASLCAIDHGRAVDTTMGLTPLGGLVMGRRSGDLDPGLLLHLMTRENLSPARAAQMLAQQSGLQGVSGLSHDMRTLLEAAHKGDQRALRAIELFCYQVRKGIGSMATVLDGCEALVFTGGIGEHSSGIRARICQGLAHLGLVLDEQRNREGLPKGLDVVSLAHRASRIPVLVVRSNEARMMARETIRALGRDRVDHHLQEIPDKEIPIGVSAHHVHLCQEHVEALFGPGHQLTPKAALLQPGQFACEERVNLIGPRGRVERVRVLGPVRSASQVEISRTEEFALGIDAPIRNSGDLDGTPGIVLEGRHATIELSQGVICARRHIHMSLADARNFAVQDRDVVMVEVRGARPLVFGDVLVRAKDSYALEMHIDTDEANAGEISSGMLGRLIRVQSKSLF